MQEKEAITISNSSLSNADRAYHKLFYTEHPELLSKRDLTRNGVLVLGPARSGTSWLSSVLSYSENVRLYFNEPLYHINPFLPFGEVTGQRPYFLRNDHTAAPYTKCLSKEHPLWCVYKSLLNTSFNGVKMLNGVERNIIQLKPQTKGKVLIKEVHALMASEGLVSRWDGPIIMITRNPVFAVDSLLHYRTLKAHMWRKEAQHICENSFLKRFFTTKIAVIQNYLKQYVDDGESRSSVIMSKVLTVAIINRMLQTLAKENKAICFIQYEELCRNSEVNFKHIADHCGLETGSAMKHFIAKSTTTEDVVDPDPYNVFRNSKGMVKRPLKFIKENELENIKTMLKMCGLENQLKP